MSRAPRRTGIDECIHYLGEIGSLMFFARAALDPGAKGADLLRWTLHLQKVLLAHPADATLKSLKIDAPQISTWRRANPISWTPPRQAEQALSLRTLAIEVTQETTSPPGWKGHLLIVYEPRTKTLVHHFLKLNRARTAAVSADWIFYVLAGADRIIRERSAALGAPQDSVSISVPNLKDTAYAAAYDEAVARLQAALLGGSLSGTWHRNASALSLHNAQIAQTVGHYIHAARSFQTAQTFRNALIRTARAFTAQTDLGCGVWIALNPLKGEIDRKPGWADRAREERLRREAATPRTETLPAGPPPRRASLAC